MKPIELLRTRARRVTRASQGFCENGETRKQCETDEVSNEYRLDVGRRGGTNHGSHQVHLSQRPRLWRGRPLRGALRED